MLFRSLLGRAENKGTRFADDYSLTLGGLGGDPFPGGQFSVRKSGLYDLRVSYRQSYYVWNRDDSAPLPSGFRGLTTNHDWNTVRKFGSANFNIKATDSLRFGAEFYRGTRNGLSFTTRTIDYFNAPSAWGSFARANPYYVEAPINEEANRFTGSVDYTRKRWTAHYRVGYQSFNSIIRGENTSTPQRSPSLKLSKAMGITMNSWMSTLLGAWAPPFRMFIMGTGRRGVPWVPR